jgi:hypothetical protein
MNKKLKTKGRSSKLLKGWSRGGHSKEETWMKPPGLMFEAHNHESERVDRVTSLWGNKQLCIQMRQSGYQSVSPNKAGRARGGEGEE